MAADNQRDQFESREAEILGIKRLPYRDHRPTSTVLRVISTLSIVGLSVPGAFAFLIAIAAGRDYGYLVLLGIGLFVQGVFLYAFFSALALIVEDLSAIRKVVAQEDKSL
jgi:hypothetical protein